MPQYLYFDSTQPAPQPVLGRYDTDFASYPALPAASDLLEVTAAQWQETMQGIWAINAGVPVVYTPPAPVLTLAQQAQAALYAGLSIALSGTLTLAATLFPVDPVTTGKIANVITTVGATGKFPGGATSYPMKDSSGAWHTLTQAQYVAVAGAIATYVAALDLIADGNPLAATALPAPSVFLTV